MDYFSQWQSIPVAPKDWQHEPNELAHPGRQRIFDLITASKFTSVLEVACGIGIDYPRYHAVDIKYYGVDITPKFITQAQKVMVPCEVADARNLPFLDNSFDVVYCKDLFIHLPPNVWKNVLAELARVAKYQVLVLDDAWVKITDYRPCEKYMSDEGTLTFWNNRYGETEVRSYAESIGLTVSVLDGGSVKRIHVEGNIITPDIIHPSQITMYIKKEKKVW